MATMAKPLIIFFHPVQYALNVYKELSTVARTSLVGSKTRHEFFQDVETKYKDAVAIYRTSATGSVRVISYETTIRKKG